LTFVKGLVRILFMTPRQLVDRFVTVQAVALKLGLTRQTIYNWLKAGKIPPRTAPLVRERLAK
jgi:DNA invertase Pin-like site-specific DNA recombinase